MKKKFISKKALDHASRGTFVYSNRFTRNKSLTMKSGGHGEENISFLRKKRFSCGVDTEYENGVRLGHIDRSSKSSDRRKDGHTWFPSNWDKAALKRAGQHVASLERNKKLIDGKHYTGRYRGVSVGIIARKGRIKTVFPLYDVNRHARKPTKIKFSK